MTKIRTSVVGLSKGITHAEAFQLAEQSELCWVVDIDEPMAKETAEKFNCRYTTDYLEILDEVDAISFCTPNYLHAPQVLRAIAAGKHVIVDKPMALTEEQCLEMIQAADEKGVTLMVAYILRYFPALRKLKEILDSGQYGQPINMSCWVKLNLVAETGNWHSRKETLGGGVFFSQGCHYIDIFIWLMGSPAHIAGFGTRNGTEWMEGDGSAQSIMKFENGALGHLFISWGMKYKDSGRGLQINTTDAQLTLDNKLEKLEVLDRDGRKVLFDAAVLEPKKPKAQLEIEHFLDCIQYGRRPEPDGNEALKSLRAIWSLHAQDGFK